MSELRELENEVATVLLDRIKTLATEYEASGAMLDLANAYAAVVAAAPGEPRKSGRAAFVG